MNSIEVSGEMRRAQADFPQLIGRHLPAILRRRSNGTRWTTRQLLFHMVFGYVVVRTLMPLVTPSGVSDTAAGSPPH